MVNVEGKGCIAPRSRTINIPEDDMRVLKRRADEIKKLRYNGRSDLWGRGVNSNSVRIGLEAEYASCVVIGAKIDIGLLPNSYDCLCNKHGRAEVKGNTNGELVVRTDKVSPNADYFIFVDCFEEERFVVLGYLHRSELLASPKKPGRGPWENFVVDRNRLANISELRNRSTIGCQIMRYPGGKGRVSKSIIKYFPNFKSGFLPGIRGYREPFFGSGAIGMKILPKLDPNASVWINDIDYGVYALWEALRHKDLHKRLLRKVENYTPSSGDFKKFRDRDGTVEDIVQAAFEKFVLHQISFSGLGYKAGSAIGGHKQSGSYKVDARWNLTRLRRNIICNHEILSRFINIKITHVDFEKVLVGVEEDTLVYCDPTYVSKGPQLYKYSMSNEDHVRLAARLRGLRLGSVFVSYDDCELVRSLYDGCVINEIPYTSTIAGPRKNKDILIKVR